MSKIAKINEEIEEILLIDKTLEYKVYTELAKMVSSATTHSLHQTDQGWCFKFNIPITPVNKLFKLINLDPKKVFEAYKKDWGKPAMTNKMHSDPYYQILLLLVLYGLKNKKHQFTESALFIILMKIWNGRKAHYLPYCDPKIMNYIVSNMNKKYIANKHDGPLFAIKDYFIPTLLKKYSRNILANPGKKDALQRLFEQAWSRMSQMFVQNKITNISTGIRENTGGFLPLYKKAKEEGSAINTPMIQNDEDEMSLMSINDREKISSDIADYIVSNNNITYSSGFINTLKKYTNTKKQTIELIASGIHSYDFYDQIEELILLFLVRLNIHKKEKLCKPEIYSDIKKKIISSKNNKEVLKIRRISDHIIESIFKKNQLDKAFKVHSGLYQNRTRSVLYYLVFNDMKKIVCKGRSGKNLVNKFRVKQVWID